MRGFLPFLLTAFSIAVIWIYFSHSYGLFKMPQFEKLIKTSAEQKKEAERPLKIKAKTLSSGRPKIVFVIDDIGYTIQNEDLLISLRDSVTYAVLPMLPYSGHFGLLTEKTGAEAILHLPLEPENETIAGRGLITERMTKSQILDILNRDLLSVPHHLGVSNHMGSRGSGNLELMQIILQNLKRRKLFYLDSHTTPNSVAVPVAEKIGLPILTRSVFLDNEDDPDKIRIQVASLTQVAQEQRYAIGIGHYRYQTLKVLSEEIPALKDKGYEIISLSDLVNLLNKK